MMEPKFRTINNKRWKVLNEFQDKSKAIVAQDDWKEQIRMQHKKQVMVRLDPVKDSKGIVIWQVISNEGR